MAVKECERGEVWCLQCCVVRGIDTKQMCMIPNNESVFLSMVEHTKWSDELKLEFLTMEIGPMQTSHRLHHSI